jgi:rRNA maturation protein Nop10
MNESFDRAPLRKCPNGHGTFEGENICPECGEITEINEDKPVNEDYSIENDEFSF